MASTSPPLNRLSSERFEVETRRLPGKPLYVVVEKILGRGESLPADWQVYGTTRLRVHERSQRALRG